MAKTVKLKFVGTDEEGEHVVESLVCDVSEDKNGDYLCEAEDGRFIKFSAGADLAAAVKAHNAANK